MRTFIGFAILAVAGLAGYFLLPKAIGGSSVSPSLDKAAGEAGASIDRAGAAALNAAAVPVGAGAEVIDEVADVPYWAWLVPGGQLVYAAGAETAEEISEYFTGAGED